MNDHRPGRLRASTLIVLGILVALGASTWVITGSIFAAPSPRVDYLAELNQRLGPAPPDHENALEIYERAIELARATPGWPDDDHSGLTRVHRRRSLDYLRVDPWGDPLQEEGLALLEDMLPALEALDDVVERSLLHAPYSATIPAGHTVPHLLTGLELGPWTRLLWEFSNLNGARMRIAAMDDDWDTVLRSLRTGLRVSEHLTQRVLLIDWLWARSIRHETMLELRRVAIEHNMPSEVCEAAIGLIDASAWPARSQDVWIETELQVAMRDAIQWSFTDNGRGDGALIMWMTDRMSDGAPIAAMLEPPSWAERFMNLRSVVAPRRAETEKLLDDLLVAERRALAAPQERRIDIGRSLHDEAERHPFFVWGRPYIRHIMMDVDRLATLEVGTRLVLRLQAFRHREGRWPDALDEFASAGEIVDPVTGDDFIYTPAATDADPEEWSLPLPSVGMRSHGGARDMRPDRRRLPPPDDVH